MCAGVPTLQQNKQGVSGWSSSRQFAGGYSFESLSFSDRGKHFIALALQQQYTAHSLFDGALFFSVYSSSGSRSCPQRLWKTSRIFFLSQSIKTLYNILANRPNPATNAHKPQHLLPSPGVTTPTEHAAVPYRRLCNRVFRVSSFLSIRYTW